MTISSRPDCEVRALVKTLLLEHDDATMVAQLLVEFARTCELIGLDRSAQRFRAGAALVAANDSEPAPARMDDAAA